MVFKRRPLLKTLLPQDLQTKKEEGELSKTSALASTFLGLSVILAAFLLIGGL